MILFWPSKDPNNIESFFIIWCDETGINTGAAADNGELQGETIATVAWTVPTGLTEVSHNQDAVTIKGVSYGVNTVCTIKLSSGTDGTNYDVLCRITTATRTLDQTVTLPVRAS